MTVATRESQIPNEGTNLDFPQYSNEAMDALMEVRGKRIRQETHRFLSMLPDAARRQLHKRRRLESAEAYALALAGLPRRRVRGFTSVYERTAHLPALRKVLMNEIGVVSKIRTVLPMATPANDEELAARVRGRSKRELERLARAASKRLSESLSLRTVRGSEAEDADAKRGRPRLALDLSDAVPTAHDAPSSRREPLPAYAIDAATLELTLQAKSLVEGKLGRPLSASRFQRMLVERFLATEGCHRAPTGLEASRVRISQEGVRMETDEAPGSDPMANGLARNAGMEPRQAAAESSGATMQPDRSSRAVENAVETRVRRKQRKEERRARQEQARVKKAARKRRRKRKRAHR